jgi:hypothetical protein
LASPEIKAPGVSKVSPKMAARRLLRQRWGMQSTRRETLSQNWATTPVAFPILRLRLADLSSDAEKLAVQG